MIDVAEKQTTFWFSAFYVYRPCYNILSWCSGRFILNIVVVDAHAADIEMKFNPLQFTRSYSS